LFDGDASGFAFEPSRPGHVEKRRRPQAIRTAGGVRLARHRRGGGDANIVETGRVEDFDRGAGERGDREMQAAAMGIAGRRRGGRRDQRREFVSSRLREVQRKRSSRRIPDRNDRLAIEKQGRRIERAVRGGDREFDASLRSPRFPAKPELHATRNNLGAGGL
jgi:hypothetical protein